MTGEQFLEEVKSSNICPDNFENIYSKFQVFQREALRTLIETHRVCELNHIPYELAYGSLLGLVRDGGQIPWDYDIDIIVPFEYKQALVDALNKDLNTGYYYYSTDNNPLCRHMIMRIAPKEYRTEALHVDVFFYIGTPEDEEKRKAFAHKVKKISIMRFGKLVNCREEAVGDKVKFLKLLIGRKAPAMFVSLKQIDNQYRILCEKYPTTTSSYCISADTFADWKAIPSKLLWDTKIVKCSYGEIRIPVHYDELLTIMYGDYKKVPSLQGRIHEVLSNYKRIIKFNNLEV